MFSRKTNRRTFSESRIWKKHAKAIFLSLLLTIGVFAMYYITVRAKYFDVSEITVMGANRYVSETDLKEISRTYLQGKNVFSANVDELRQRMLELFRGIKDVKIYRELPNKIVVNVTERKPIAIFRSTKSKEKFIVDADGYVLGTVLETDDYPVIDYAQDIKVGLFINRDLVPIYTDIIKGLDGEKLVSTSLSFFDTYTKVYLSTGTEIVLSNAKSITDSLNIAKELLENLEKEKKVVKKIDLRYDKVIVSYD